jgi:hypothetical protein
MQDEHNNKKQIKNADTRSVHTGGEAEVINDGTSSMNVGSVGADENGEQAKEDEEEARNAAHREMIRLLEEAKQKRDAHLSLEVKVMKDTLLGYVDEVIERQNKVGPVQKIESFQIETASRRVMKDLNSDFHET